MIPLLSPNPSNSGIRYTILTSLTPTPLILQILPQHPQIRTHPLPGLPILSTTIPSLSSSGKSTSTLPLNTPIIRTPPTTPVHL